MRISGIERHSDTKYIHNHRDMIHKDEGAESNISYHMQNPRNHFTFDINV